MLKKLELKGQRFGKLVVLEEAGEDKHRKTLWLCRCDCGREVIINGSSLKSGNTKNCGKGSCKWSYIDGLSQTKERKKEYDKQKQLQDDPKFMFRRLKSNAKNRNIPLEFTKESWVEWYPAQERICGYCDVSISRVNGQGTLVASGISLDRKDNEGPYSEENCVLACNGCNKVKSNIFTYDEMRFIGQYILKPKWQSTAAEWEK